LQLPRADKELIEPIEQLHARYLEAGKNPRRAYESLTTDEIQFVTREVRRCLSSPKYYLQNYHFIRTKKLQIMTIYPLYDAQELFMKEFMYQFNLQGIIRIIVLKARQLGITTISVSIMCWLCFFHPMCHVMSMSDEDERVSVNFDMARTAYSFLEWWMKPEKRYDQKPQLLGFDRSKADDREDTAGLESKLYFESANQPSGAAYSKSLYGAHMAEIGRYRSPKPITEGIFGSLVNFRHSIGIMESTAQGRHSVFHKLWKAAERGEFWAPIFMEWFREPGYVFPVTENFARTKEEVDISKLVKEECNFEIKDEQLSWRREKIKEFSATGDEDIFPQEFPLTPEEAFVSSGLTAFPKKRLNEQIIAFARTPRWVGEIKLAMENNRVPVLHPYVDGNFRIWEYPRAGEDYQVGADCAMGIDGGDYSCAVVYHVPKDIKQPIRQVARWRGYLPPTEYARVLAAIGYMYNTAEIAPEVNKIDSVASDLSKVLLYPKVYRWMREDKIKNALSQFIGWLTTGRNKANLIGRFRDALLGWTVVIKCSEDIDEMFDFVETEPGSGLFSARSGGHDDTVMAHMIAFYTATQLRPRWAWDQDQDKKKDENEGRDYQNTDYSPIYDGKPSGGPSKGYPDFMEL
jgi:hypothetical protein